MRARRGGVAAVTAALVCVMMSPAQAAVDPEDKKEAVEASAREQREHVHDASEALREAQRRLDDAEARLPDARAAEGEATQALAAAQHRQDGIAASLDETEAEVDDTERQLDGIRESMAGHREAVGQMARRAYAGGEYAKLALLVDARSPESLTSALTYLDTAARSQRNVLTELAADKAELGQLRAELEAARMRLAAEQDEAEDAVARTQARRQVAAEAAADVQALVDQRASALADAEDERAAAIARLEELQAEADRLSKLIAARAAEAARAAQRHRDRQAEREAEREPTGSGLLSFPVTGPITSGFGMRYHPILHYTKLHTGTDFGVPSGTPVHAAAAGRVLQAYYNTAYGNRVVVEHGTVDGTYLVTTYNHLTNSTVRAGQRLSRGQVLGYVGATGYATGPHLHFEVLEDGTFVNPMTWLE